MDPNDPLGLNSLLSGGQAIATQLGMSWDPNPLHSTVLQAAAAAGSPTSTPPIFSTQSGGGLAAAPPASSFSSNDKGMLMLAGLGLAYLVLK